MTDAIFNWLLDNFPWIVPSLAIGFGAWKLSRWEKRLSDTAKDMELLKPKMEALPCQEHHQTLADHTGKAQATDQRLASIREQISTLPWRDHARHIETVGVELKNTGSIVTELSKWVMKIDETMIDRLMQKCSPMRMTPAGEQLFTMSHADRALDILAPRLMQQMSEAELRTEYDVEAKALETLLQNTSDPAFDQVKNFVYAAPDTFTPEGDGDPIKFTFYSIVHLMGIRLRDMYLEQHPVASPAISAAE